MVAAKSEAAHTALTAMFAAHDIERADEFGAPPVAMPQGFKPSRYEVTIRGLCPECAAKAKR